MIDDTKNGEAFDYTVGHDSSLHGNEMIHGYVTITKNAGKDNEEIIVKNKHNLLTNAGRDYFHAQCYTNTSAGGVGCNFVALSENSIPFPLITSKPRAGVDVPMPTLPSLRIVTRRDPPV